MFIIIIIAAPPPRVLIPRNASVEPRTDAIITCNIFSLDENIEVKWYRGLDPRFELKNGRRHTIKLNQDTPAGGLASAFTSTLTIRCVICYYIDIIYNRRIILYNNIH
ncbi:unnamed protein product [Schistosoma mattheei]|uniref:Ig-like domain-containing protein n=1 Tax=Schistosoma mattheei TaxID=31246 RepID=A0A3P8H1T4_9TREM|nr:unnamed protein product [Schistosoma mattheei]